MSIKRYEMTNVFYILIEEKELYFYKERREKEMFVIRGGDCKKAILKNNKSVNVR